MSHASTFPIQRSGRSSFGFPFSDDICICRIAFVLSGAKKFLTFGTVISVSAVVGGDDTASIELMDVVADVAGKTSSIVMFSG